MNECYFCGASGNSAHIALVKVRGKRDGVRIQKKYKDMRRVPYLEKQRRHKRSSRCNGRLGLRRNKRKTGMIVSNDL